MRILLIEEDQDLGQTLIQALEELECVVDWQTETSPENSTYDAVIEQRELHCASDETLSPQGQIAASVVNSLAKAWEQIDNAHRAKRRALQQARNYSRLAANLSHELKTPIAAILTTAQTMLRCERTSDKYKQALRLCERNSRSMSQLIRRMLDLSKAGSDAWEPKFQSTDPRTLLATSIDLHTPIADDDGVVMLMVCREDQLIETDADLLLIMINNLLGNAIRYTPRGKTVIIRYIPESTERGATISVIDEGPGIRPEVRPHIFDAFYQDEAVQSYKVRHNSNYGLGLALTAELAERLQIRIAVDSSPGKGAAFHLTLPKKDA
ncbi:sensor histidine kinase [Cerasicoccus maritimus]|uniref:sensor histidine kinase n=1 Tax=Cerasicoccus maritimus TaxID=490089 RepID=UPI0028525D76|nr:hybrid sensor histidine kinase/response regulator [Cerasicoccus maritimus]